MGNKNEKCLGAGIGSSLATVGGVIIMVTTGPIGVVVGATVLSGGIGGITNSLS